MVLPPDFRSPFDDLLGGSVVTASPDEVVVTIAVTPRLHQPGGVVHGGVYATLVETAASIGANLWLAGDGTAVGVANTTQFLRAVRDGELRAEAVPLQRGRSLQLWQVHVRDSDRLAASGMVRLMNLRREPLDGS